MHNLEAILIRDTSEKNDDTDALNWWPLHLVPDSKRQREFETLKKSAQRKSVRNKTKCHEAIKRNARSKCVCERHKTKSEKKHRVGASGPSSVETQNFAPASGVLRRIPSREPKTEATKMQYCVICEGNTSSLRQLTHKTAGSYIDEAPHGRT